MREEFIETENHVRLLESFARLEKLPPTAPRIGLGYGNFGLGKTWSLERIAVRKNAILLRANDTWTKREVLELLCGELKLDVGGGSGKMYKRVKESLLCKPRILIVDEVDTLLKSQYQEVFEILRALHDEAYLILYYIGMEEANGKFKRFRHYYSRIVELLFFRPTHVDDIRKLCALCEVGVGDDLVAYFVKRYPNMRQIKVFLIRIEEECAVQELEEIGYKEFVELRIEHEDKKER